MMQPSVAVQQKTRDRRRGIKAKGLLAQFQPFPCKMFCTIAPVCIPPRPFPLVSNRGEANPRRSFEHLATPKHAQKVGSSNGTA